MSTRELAPHDSQVEHWRNHAIALEQQNANLIHLYSAVFMLYSEIRRESVLQALQQIIVNQIGSESFAILEATGSGLSVLAEMGPIRWRDDLPAMEKVQAARTFVGSADESRAEGEPLVVVPLVFEEEMVGSIVIYDLLPQKPELRPFDHELFDLVSFHGGTALAACRFRTGSA